MSEVIEVRSILGGFEVASLVVFWTAGTAPACFQSSVSPRMYLRKGENVPAAAEAAEARSVVVLVVVVISEYSHIYTLSPTKLSHDTLSHYSHDTALNTASSETTRHSHTYITQWTLQSIRASRCRCVSLQVRAVPSPYPLIQLLHCSHINLI